MKAAVTGARGFVGRHLEAHLHDEGDDVATLDLGGTSPVDVTDAAAVTARVHDIAPDALYHLAALTHVDRSWEDPRSVFRVNVEGTANVLAACRSAGVRRVVVVGSAEQYGRVGEDALAIREDEPLRPLSPYARSKAAAEALALAESARGDVEVVCVRAFNHTGPGQSTAFLVPALAARVVAAERLGHDDVAVGNVEPVRDVTDVRDVVRAYRLLARHGEPGAVYNVCSGTGVRVAELAERLLALAQRPLRLRVDPDLVRAVDVPALVGDPARLRAATGWTPAIPLDRTLADVLAEARARM